MVTVVRRQARRRLSNTTTVRHRARATANTLLSKATVDLLRDPRQVIIATDLLQDLLHQVLARRIKVSTLLSTGGLHRGPLHSTSMLTVIRFNVEVMLPMLEAVLRLRQVPSSLDMELPVATLSSTPTVPVSVRPC